MSDTLILSATRRLSAAVANRTSRRSFIGRASGVAFVAAAATFPDTAQALTCDCAGPNCNNGCGNRSIHCGANGHSVSCKGLTGFGGQCPANTAACGAWSCTCSSCTSGVRIWTDCCAANDQCSSTSSCLCVPDTDGVSRPSCCYGHCYQGGQSGCHYIYCRYETCG